MSDDPYVNLPLPKRLPRAFLFRRLHSIAGLFFVLFLCEHMLTNSGSALLIQEQGAGFIRAVNFLQSLPYLNFIEIFLLAVPIAIHAVLGIVYFFEARFNSHPSDGSTPSLTWYIRNQAFTWQRITALLIVIGVIAHVTSMRFVLRPQEIDSTPQTKFAISVAADPGLITLAPRLKTTLITPESQAPLLSFLQRREMVSDHHLQRAVTPALIAAEKLQKERLMETHAFIANLHPTHASWTAICEDFGTACLLIVRENFRTPWICVLYTIFVLAAAFHAANGLWTFAIAWGITLNESGRRVVRGAGIALGMALLAGGLASIWLTYWVTLRT
jgi:succinate dehydrogenase / fumarate reductase cytochrome b subunit